MTILKEKLSDFKEKFEQAQKLVDECKVDTLEPYKNHYKSKEILIDLEVKLEKTIEQTENEQDLLVFRAILGYVQKDIGKICSFVEETNQAKIYLNKSLELLEGNKNEPEIIICYVDTLNQLGILWSKLQDNEKSLEYLLKSEKAANSFKKFGKQPLTIFDIFGTSDEIEKGKGKECLEKNLTLTFFYLAQVYGAVSNLEASGLYCHLTLKRQLELEDYEPVEWALNAATLSQFYFAKNMLKQSRHLLAAANYMMGKYSDELEQKEMSEDQRAAAMENFKHRSADVDLCFAKYCIYILTTSIERLMQEKEESHKETDPIQFQINENCEKFNLDLSLYEREVVDDFVLTFEDAKEVFLAAQSYLNKAKEYYSLENEASQHARIVQDYAHIFKHLAFFEDEPGVQSKLHKRRADQLEEVLTQLNPTYYMNICRELMFELGLTYSDMLDIKCDLLKFNEVQPTALSKINTLCHKAINKFKEFENTYRDKKTGEIPDNLDVDELQVVACANFNLGRLYYKIITPDKKMQLENTSSSYKHYKTFIDYCEKHQTIAERMKGEYGVTKNMCELLPLKIKKLMDESKQ
ncbi:CLUMA_CG009550, isoform A [Clunio marinus]|uniref:KIF-binding protein n=1 Tax=Clunio marinus TaxID=568069 RepID=A0A1J1I787_9DIPT|nr:CLUMA_CG009550, isoform A [Clunio marinus]